MKIGFNNYAISFRGNDNRTRIKAQNAESEDFARLRAYLSRQMPDVPQEDNGLRERIQQGMKKFQERQRKVEEAKMRKAEARRRRALSKPEMDALRIEEKRIKAEIKAEIEAAKARKLAEDKVVPEKPIAQKVVPKSPNNTVKERYKDKLVMTTEVISDGSIYIQSVKPVKKNGEIVHLNINLEPVQRKKLDKLLPDGLLEEMAVRAKEKGYIFHLVQNGNKIFSAMTLEDGRLCMWGEYDKQELEKAIWKRADMVGLYKPKTDSVTGSAELDEAED